jgi:hypothetical protein
MPALFDFLSINLAPQDSEKKRMKAKSFAGLVDAP